MRPTNEQMLINIEAREHGGADKIANTLNSVIDWLELLQL